MIKPVTALQTINAQIFVMNNLAKKNIKNVGYQILEHINIFVKKEIIFVKKLAILIWIVIINAPKKRIMQMKTMIVKKNKIAENSVVLQAVKIYVKNKKERIMKININVILQNVILNVFFVISNALSIAISMKIKYQTNKLVD